jgi:hypothetical protein
MYIALWEGEGNAFTCEAAVYLAIQFVQHETAQTGSAIQTSSSNSILESLKVRSRTRGSGSRHTMGYSERDLHQAGVT